jgi:hypothetical protein
LSTCRNFESHCSALLFGVTSLMCIHQFTRSACVKSQSRCVKPDQQCPSRKTAQAGNGTCSTTELHGSAGASDPTRMANICESSTEPSLGLSGLRQLSAPAKQALQQVISVMQRDAVLQTLSGDRRSLNGELMRLRERGNPDHWPSRSHWEGRLSARNVDGCGE